MIEVKHLTKRYGSFLAVDDLSFTVEDGQIYGFLGPNGAGKSTTMNILTGYLSSSEGSVSINGYDIFDEPEAAKRQMGYLPEQPPLYGDMTVREYLGFVADLKKVPKAERGRLEDIIAIAGLGEVSSRLIRTLSKGFRQRVGIAQALVGDPPIIILDEPTVGLDPLQMIEIRTLIRDLAKNHTVILSSHILSEVANVCDKVLIIAHGRLVAQDTPDNLAQMMRGSNEYGLVVRGRAESVKAILSKLPLTHASIHVAKDGLLHLDIECAPDTDPREQLFYALAAARMPILEESVTTLSLEQVFLELTGADNGGDERGTARRRRAVRAAALRHTQQAEAGADAPSDASAKAAEPASAPEAEASASEPASEPAPENPAGAASDAEKPTEKEGE